MDNIIVNFRWNRVFLKEFAKISYSKFIKNYNYLLLLIFYFILYGLHWIFINDEIFGQKIVTMIFHLVLILLSVNIFFFYRASSGAIEKKHINKDRDSNLIG